MSRRTFVKIEIAFILAIPAWAGFSPNPFNTMYIMAYYYLVTGWAIFLSRVVPNMVINWTTLGIAGICLIGLIIGLHFFFTWLHREVARKQGLQQLGPDEKLPSLHPWKFRTTFCILGIVVLMFIAGISSVGSVHQLVWLRTRQ